MARKMFVSQQMTKQHRIQPKQQQRQHQKSPLTGSCDFDVLRSNYKNQQQQQQHQNRNQNQGERIKNKLNQIGLRVDNDNLLSRSLSKLFEATKSGCLARLSGSNDRPQDAAANRAQVSEKTSANGFAMNASSWSVPATLKRSRSLIQSRRTATLAQNEPNKSSVDSNRWTAIRRTEFVPRSSNRDGRDKGAIKSDAKTASFMDNLLVKEKPKLLTFSSSVGNKSNRGGSKQAIVNKARTPAGGGPMSMAPKQSRSNCVGGTNKVVKMLTSTAPARRLRQACSLRLSLSSGSRLLFATCASLMLLFCLNSCGGGLFAETAALGGQLASEPLKPMPWNPAGMGQSEADDSADNENSIDSADTGQERQVDIGNLLDQIQNQLGLQQLQSEVDWLSSENGQSAGNQDNAGQDLGEQQEEEQQQQIQQREQSFNEPNEYFWIERRRLNRDRALEPPAWLRTRPIRSDDLQQQLEDPSDQEAQVTGSEPNLKSGAAHTRQQRQSVSNKYYDELVKYLLEGTVEGRSILDNFYDSLPAEARSKQSRVGPGGGSGSGSTLMDVAQPGDSDQSMQTAGQIENASPMAKMDLGGAGSDQGLIVAGDEISDSDDVTTLDVPLVQVAAAPSQEQQQQQLPKSQPTLVIGRKIQVSSQAPSSDSFGAQQQAGNRQVDANADKLTVAAGQLGQTQTDPLSASLTLAELMQSANLLSPQQQQVEASDGNENGQLTPIMANNNDEQPFHVIEDIDQVDASQEIPVDQNADTSELGGFSGNKEKRFDNAKGGRNQVDSSNLVLLDVPDAKGGRVEPNKLFGFRSGTKSSFQKESDQRAQEEALNLMSLLSTDPRRAPMNPEKTTSSTAPRSSLPSGQAAAATARQLWSQLAQVAPENDVGKQRSQLVSPKQYSIEPANETGAPLPDGSQTQFAGATEATIELIQAGYFTKEQLIQFATKLRAYLESRLSLPRGSILGLFPETDKRLLIELDPAKLSGFNLAYLSENFNYIRGSSSLVLSWPGNNGDLGENLIPILRAIMDALYDYQLEQKAQWNDKASSPTKAESLQINEQQQQKEQAAADAVELRMDEAVGKPGAAGYLDATQAAAYLKEPGIVVRLPQLQMSQVAGAALAPESQINWAEGQQDDQLSLLEQKAASPVTWWTSQQYASDKVNDPRQQQGRLPLALLAAYLSGVYKNLGNFQNESPLVSTWPQTDLSLEQLSLLASNNLQVSPGARHFARTASNGTATASWTGKFTGIMDSIDQLIASYSVSFYAALLLAVATTFMMLKLITYKLDRKMMNRYTGVEEGLEHDPSRKAKPERDDGPSKSASSSWWPFRLARRKSSTEESTIEGQTARDGSGQLLGDSSLSGSHKKTKLADFDQDKLMLARKLEGDQQQSQKCSCKALRKSVESLSKRWNYLMNNRYGKMAGGCSELADEKASKVNENADVERVECSGGATSAEQKLIETSETTEAPSPGYRTSTSYIRSLIEALTKAATNQMATQTPPSSKRLGNSQIDDDDDDDEQMSGAGGRGFSVGSTDGSYGPMQHKQLFCNDDNGDILMSQMDISAAHLILDYMEKHLIDKERLRREWLELNANFGSSPAAAGSDGANNNKSSGGNNKATGGHPKGPRGKNLAAKANQLILQRLAKVALSEENLDKNRDPSVVPFDRNRVRLGASGHLSVTGPGSGGASKSIRNRASPASDYINASYIYDDDPRRPTHIVAQGPMEQTCGQFWQMIWEQEISVIVMLTRLNENGEQMCHCYWPLSITQIAPTAASSQAISATGRVPLSDHNNNNNTSFGPMSGNGSGGRRGSVTSVFSGSNVGQHQSLHHLHHHAAPIVASGQLKDNILTFEVPIQRAGRNNKTSFGSSSSSSGGSSSEGYTELHANNGTGKRQRSANEKGATMKLEVHLISEHVSASDYLVRNMYLINCTTGETRTISQFHYLAWLNGGTPDNVRSFLQFRRKVHQSYRNLKSPILVHCNNGAGRSGTYTLIDMILERIKNGAKEIDLKASLEHLRDQRLGLCETQAQFEFVLVALAEEIQIILNALPQ